MGSNDRNPGHLAIETYNTENAVLDLANDHSRIGTHAGVLFGWWSDTSSAGAGSFDTALARAAAGVVEVNNGTVGTLADIEVRNTVVDNVIKLTPLSSPPSNPGEGWIYAGTDHHLYYYNGSTWKQLDN